MKLGELNKEELLALAAKVVEEIPELSIDDAVTLILNEASDDDAIEQEVSIKDVNNDGDPDVQTADTNGNGEPDTAVVTADSEKEEKDAVKAAKEELNIDGNDKTSTGKTKAELTDEQKTVSDSRQKNILGALLEHRF